MRLETADEFMMSIDVTGGLAEHVFEVTFRNSETGTEATTRVRAPSIGDAHPLAKARIRSLPAVPDHVLWVIRNYDDCEIERIDPLERPRLPKLLSVAAPTPVEALTVGHPSRNSAYHHLMNALSG
jgi:hypothetical protein